MPRRPHVALIIETSSACGRGILGGIRRYVDSHAAWSILLEPRGRATPSWTCRDDWPCDGIIVRSTTPQIAAAVAESEIPAVELSDGDSELGLPGIRSDDHAIGQLGAQHLLEHGFRHMAFCGFSTVRWSVERGGRFTELVEQRATSCHTYESPPWEADPSTWAAARHHLAQWLASLPKPVGIMACNDVRGYHVVDTCHDLDLAVPEKVAVVGVDNDHTVCELCVPPLSSVIPNADQIGYKAAELLAELMAGGTPATRQQLVEPVGVATRQSTDVLAISHPETAAAVRFLREHACEGATIADVLKNVAISRSALERRIRKHLGYSPQTFIRHIRIDRVKQLLIETDLNLGEISELTGFKHCEHMCVVFKRDVGKSPGEFRHHQRR
jgi:LacI family transcriptional regulator